MCIRDRSRATISIVTYGREFAINVRCDPKTLTQRDANEFLDLFAARLAEHVPAMAEQNEQQVEVLEAPVA